MKTRSLILFTLFCAPSLAAQDIDVDLTSGKSMYNAWCAKCHGEDGRGIVEDLELEAPPPDFSDCSFNSREPRKDWKAVIAHGGQARGLSMSMPAWEGALTSEQMDLIIAHIKTFCSDTRWPQGELNFRRAQVTGKAFPENEALFIPAYTQSVGRALTSKFVYEERIGPRGQWEVSLPFVTNMELAETTLGDAEFSVKYVLYDDTESLTIFSAGLEVALPTSTLSDGPGWGHFGFLPFVAAGRGFGNVVLQSNIKYEHAILLPYGSLQYNLAATYHFSDDKHGVIPMVELNGVTSFLTHENSFFITPQLYIGLVRRGHLALSLGTQIPITRHTPYDYRIVAFFLWEYADGGLWW